MSGKKDGSQRSALIRWKQGDKIAREPYPRIRIGCLNTRAHALNGYRAVHFVIPKGKPTGDCPMCGRTAGRKPSDPK